MQLNKLTQEEIHKLATSIWNSLILASNARDYPRFSNNFSTEMLKLATCENINDQWENSPVLTSLNTEPEFMGCLKNKERVRVLWKQKSSVIDDELLGHLELIIEDGQVKVDGAQII
jgi:hypothetical protein